MNNILKAILLIMSIYVLVSGVGSCSNKQTFDERFIEPKPSDKTILSTKEVENFDKFIENFFKKSNFQFTRIDFPVTNLVFDSETNGFDTNQINRDDWKYWNIYSQKNMVFKITRSKSEEYILHVQLKETGVSISYIFTLKEEKWYMVKIVDEST